MSVAYLDELDLAGSAPSRGTQSVTHQVVRVPVPELPLYWRARTWPLIEPDEATGTATVTFLRQVSEVHTVLLLIEGLTDEHQPERSEMEFLGDGIFALSYRVPLGWRAAYSFYECVGFCMPPWRAAQGICPLRDLMPATRLDQKNPERIRTAEGTLQSFVEVPAA
ncbi:enterochelin esterase domain-containing protein [Nesterenkonia alba]|uniref:enterochelin esterase domain-containing protein n=1 Tax=Nesterenkonia alba TaxID=515814 RepID=UPI0003B319B0|nr:enterochelin esterase domain-containing protein [Nesterenkonia alba]